VRGGEGGQYDATRVRKDGARLDVALTVSPVHDASGQIIGASRIARDISVRKRVELAQAELLGREQRVRAEAEAATLAKDKFLAVLSHELRTPLSAMLGWVRILRTHKLNPASTTRALEVIERNTLLQVRLIEDLLDVSRIISGTLHVEVRPVAVAPTVKATLAMMQLAAEAKGVRLESAVDEKAGLVLADPARLQQIVSNLVSNAIKFTPGGGRVDVRLARRRSMVEISVRDTGKGITAEQLPQIFRPFGADHASTQHQGGMGLGLTIVRHLVELHRGVVHAESPGRGHGATFTVSLPRTAERADEVVASELTARGLAPDQLPALNGVRILAVDDEADARDLLKTIFAQYGAEVTVVAGVTEALTAFRQARFDVLVSDIVMPDEDGYDLIRKIRALEAERGGQIPALALTAYARIEDREAALSAGYQQHAAKPIDPAELAAAVATLAGR
jgi:signal transduction histidine kinase/ActR/RegA family two-component response regulator